MRETSKQISKQAKSLQNMQLKPENSRKFPNYGQEYSRIQNDDNCYSAWKDKNSVPKVPSEARVGNRKELRFHYPHNSNRHGGVQKQSQYKQPEQRLRYNADDIKLLFSKTDEQMRKFLIDNYPGYFSDLELCQRSQLQECIRLVSGVMIYATPEKSEQDNPHNLPKQKQVMLLLQRYPELWGQFSELNQEQMKLLVTQTLIDGKHIQDILQQANSKKEIQQHKNIKRLFKTQPYQSKQTMRPNMLQKITLPEISKPNQKASVLSQNFCVQKDQIKAFTTNKLLNKKQAIQQVQSKTPHDQSKTQRKSQISEVGNQPIRTQKNRSIQNLQELIGHLVKMLPTMENQIRKMKKKEIKQLFQQAFQEKTLYKDQYKSSAEVEDNSAPTQHKRKSTVQLNQLEKQANATIKTNNLRVEDNMPLQSQSGPIQQGVSQRNPKKNNVNERQILDSSQNNLESKQRRPGNQTIILIHTNFDERNKNNEDIGTLAQKVLKMFLQHQQAS